MSMDKCRDKPISRKVQEVHERICMERRFCFCDGSSWLQALDAEADTTGWIRIKMQWDIFLLILLCFQGQSRI